ncbi:flavodoxin family protein [Hyphococcus luteus]|uniref:FMN reductase n=1 Tax=Hyphococcus luteus TaxID=2058213 RepID=A0A2S7K459_9PROT|nr:NAD(P)H-dependent oxidoreductase [Marinicaulis flavus]PQA87228.1 FMN reductase [Marinicaulis flavus]
MNSLFILGSSRGDGQTARLAREVFRHLGFEESADAEFVDLGALDIGPYDYEYRNRGDDFLPVAQKMVRSRTIVFASPLYWYSMSGQMKIFFDRLTDLTDPPLKPLGKALAGKTMFALGTGGNPEPPDSFVHPFEDTAGYFHMDWGGFFYAKGADALEPQTQDAAKDFAARIAAVAAPLPACTA